MFGTEYFQETNPTLLFSNCNVYNEMATTPTQVPHMLQAAMQEAVGRGGVGIVGLPADVIGQPAVESYASTLPLYTKRLPEPRADVIDAAANRINQADSVGIFAGSGAKDAAELVNQLSVKVKAPVATTYKS